MGKTSRKHGFETNKSYTAVVTKIMKDRIFFEIMNTHGEVFTVAYFITGGHINPFQIFRNGQRTFVTVLSLCNPEKNNCGITMLVVPDFLPVDDYIFEHPLGSTVDAVIEKVHGSTMTVMLAPNVYASTKRCKHAKSGLSIKCKIDNYRQRNKKLSLRVIV